MSSTPEAPLATPLERREAAYVFCAALFGVVLVLTNIVGVKLFVLFPDGGPSWILDGQPWTLTSGILTYPLTFLLTDVVSELWGKKRADFMVVMGFVMSLIMLGIVQLALRLPPSELWSNPTLGLDSAQLETAFEASFYYPGILLGASMTAYLVAQLFDVRLYHFWKGVTKGKHLWLRNNGSTWISQLVDTTIVNGIFLRFGAGFGPENGWDWGRIGQVVLTVYLFKLVLALIDTPLIYLARWWVERLLGIPHDPERKGAPLA